MLSKNLQAAAGAAEPTDWANVSLLLHGDGTNGAQNNTFVDSSSGGTSITRTGTPTQGSFSPYYDAAGDYDPAINGGSGYFNGTTDYLQTVDTYAIGTQNFTIEAWVYCSSYSVNQQIISLDGGTTSRFVLFVENTNDLVFRYTGTGSDITYATGLTVNQWEHVAVVREGTGTNQTKIYLNGTQVAQGTVATNYATDNFNIGTGRTPSNYITGYLSDVRVVIGTAVYTSNFTPPTAPLTAITNTAFLCNFTNAGIYDNAMRNVLETVGNAQISTSVKKYGTGSMRFDGTGDYIKGLPSNNTIFGTSDFTIECWIYVSSLPGAYATIMMQGPPVQMFVTSASKIACWFNDNDNTLSYIVSNLQSAGSVSLNTWHHVAVVRSGTSFKVYLDGIGGTAQTSSLAVANSANGVTVGITNSNTYPFNGYIDEFRVTKGVARYTGNFTPPTVAFPNS